MVVVQGTRRSLATLTDLPNRRNPESGYSYFLYGYPAHGITPIPLTGWSQANRLGRSTGTNPTGARRA